ncbi:MAG: histidine kinase [Streptosporangiaceae bacterium]
MSASACPVLPSGVGRASFLVFTGVVGLGLALGQLKEQPPAGVAAIGAAVAVAAAVFLLLRRRPAALSAVVACAGITAVGGSRSANPVWFAMLLVVGWCALTEGRRVGLPLWLAVLALFTVQWVHFSPDQGWGAWIAGSSVMVLGGLVLRNQLILVAQLRAAQAGLASKARAEERNRISRDLHDVIAHSLTISLLHVMSARLAVESDPDDAARSLAEAERLGRESLAEVRQVVGLLRADGEGAGLDRTLPQPGASGLPSLAERFQAAGADVTLTVDGDAGRLPATVGLAVYRILQEALTNVIRHAPGAPASARLVVSEREATLTVDSLGKPGAGTGHGVPGMRERAESIGGSCSAGPSGAGWLVRASFPLVAARDAS